MPLECDVCQRRTDEFLVAPLGEKRVLGLKCGVFEEIPLCRVHLTARFGAEFGRSSQRLVVFYPNLETWHGNYQYFYAPVATFAQDYSGDRQIRNDLRHRLQTWMGLIQGRCAQCSREGQVAFFAKEVVEGRPLPGHLETGPGLFNLHKVEQLPQILCKACAFIEIAHSLQYPGPGFEAGLHAPLAQEGVYLTIPG